jgi:hypothetical protein
MNIFILDTNPITAAQMHCDKHVPKMCVEAAQMMASALRRHGATDEDMPLTKAGKPYKGGYKHHPCTVWAGDCEGNFNWLVHHAVALCEEYRKRFGKRHACHDPIIDMSALEMTLNPNRVEPMPLTPFALAMPDEYRPKHSTPTMPIDKDKYIVSHAAGSDAVKAYQAYYHSKQFAKWEKGTPAPHWWRGVEVTA